MANLKELRSRITSVSSTMQITSAMKMVSAAKLSRAQEAIVAMRPYAEKLTQLLRDLSSTMSDEQRSEYAEQRDVEKVLLVAVSSNKGLAGAFNTNIIKGVRGLVAQEYQGKQVTLMTIGKKAHDVLSKNHEVYKNHDSLFDDLTFENVESIAQDLMKVFVAGDYDKIVLVYNHFRNAGTQVVMKEQFLPIVPVERDDSKTLDYIFEPSKEDIVTELIPKSLKIQLYKAIRDSYASEHGARMTAMHKATDNATELRDSLKLSYNKARQAAITGEILEIVGGAEAQNN